ncbi:TPA: hypothetical protein DF272_01640 [Candidatus Falkowbacteria bacterium]|nr:hypothetical protein [Candidatus Falkowbacteria bacterium]
MRSAILVSILVAFLSLFTTAGGGQQCTPTPTEPVELCNVGLSCDDGDPSTEDWCSPATYTCRHETYSWWTDCGSDLDCDSSQVCGSLGNCIPSGCGADMACGHDEICYFGLCYVQDAAWCDEDADCNDGNPCTIDACSTTGKCRFSQHVEAGTICGYDSAAEQDLVCFSGQCVPPMGFCSIDAPMDMGEQQCAATSGDFDWGTFCLPNGTQKGGRIEGACQQCIPQYSVDTNIARGCTADAPLCVSERVSVPGYEYQREWWHCVIVVSCDTTNDGTICGWDNEARNIMVCYNGACVPEGVGFEQQCETDYDCVEGTRCEDSTCQPYTPRQVDTCGGPTYCQPCDLDLECQGFGYCTGPYNDDPACGGYGQCETWEAQTVILPTGRCNHSTGRCAMESSSVAETCNDGDAATRDHCVPGVGCVSDHS